MRRRWNSDRDEEGCPATRSRGRQTIAPRSCLLAGSLCGPVSDKDAPQGWRIAQPALACGHLDHTRRVEQPVANAITVTLFGDAEIAAAQEYDILNQRAVQPGIVGDIKRQRAILRQLERPWLFRLLRFGRLPNPRLQNSRRRK